MEPSEHQTNFPGPAERAELNAALFATGTETGFWDDDGRSAPWPDDIDEWILDTGASGQKAVNFTGDFEGGRNETALNNLPIAERLLSDGTQFQRPEQASPGS